MNTKIYQVDAFTDKPFAGNPAGVCILDTAMDDSWMLYIAQEMKASETAFLYPIDEGYNLRWFTPVREVAICGHATLASAHILYETGLLPEDSEARFHTQSDLLIARKCVNGIEMEFPKIKLKPTRAPDGLLKALNVGPRYIGKAGKKYVVQVENEEVVRNFIPDMYALRKLRRVAHPL
jgi:predicted PhzF superfamily epimerase YddE/YHI9